MRVNGFIGVATFGFGGYQGAQFGLTLGFYGPGWSVSTFAGPWARPPRDGDDWTEVDQSAAWAKACILLRETLQAAKKKDVAELEGVPVECVFEEGMHTLKSWRVLTEVIP